MLTLWNGLDRVFDDAFFRANDLAHRTPAPRYGRGTYPRVNVIETDAALVVSAEVPGFTPDNVDVTVHDGVLTLQGHVDEAKHDDEEGKVIYSERRHLSFKRTFTLHTDVDVDQITAVVKDGLLTVTLPKAEASKPRQIAVKTAS